LAEQKKEAEEKLKRELVLALDKQHKELESKILE